MIKRASILTVLLGFATLTGCSFPGVYKLNVQQGNIVTSDMLEQLKPGMTQRQVEYVMGNPVLRTPYDNKRWDYIYTLEKRDEIVEQYRISVFFDAAGNYSHYTGSLPAETEKEDDSASVPQPEKSNDTVVNPES